MEKLKKLSLKKEAITNISDNQMNHLWGGYGDTVDNTRVPSSPMDSCVTYCGDTCAAAASCVFACSTAFDPSSCPNYSKVDSGCPAVTCGYAWTCNG